VSGQNNGKTTGKEPTIEEIATTTIMKCGTLESDVGETRFFLEDPFRCPESFLRNCGLIAAAIACEIIPQCSHPPVQFLQKWSIIATNDMGWNRSSAMILTLVT
jgi:hypothetical protein